MAYWGIAWTTFTWLVKLKGCSIAWCALLDWALFLGLTYKCIGARLVGRSQLLCLQCGTIKHAGNCRSQWRQDTPLISRVRSNSTNFQPLMKSCWGKSPWSSAGRSFTVIGPPHRIPITWGASEVETAAHGSSQTTNSSRLTSDLCSDFIWHLSAQNVTLNSKEHTEWQMLRYYIPCLHMRHDGEFVAVADSSTSRIPRRHH